MNTASVEQGRLSAMVSLAGTLTYRARPDGSPYSVINQGSRDLHPAARRRRQVRVRGRALPGGRPAGAACCAAQSLPTATCTRALRANDVRQLNQNLHALGDDAKVGVSLDPTDNSFSAGTGKALEGLQRDRGADVTGALAMGAAVFVPESVRIARVTGVLGGPAQPGDSGHVRHFRHA